MNVNEIRDSNKRVRVHVYTRATRYGRLFNAAAALEIRVYGRSTADVSERDFQFSNSKWQRRARNALKTNVVRTFE